MPRKACTVCGRPSDQARCPKHRRPANAPWSKGRDRGKQASFRRAVLERDGYRCTWAENDRRCTVTTDLRACHRIPFRDFDQADPAAYAIANGRTLCKTHDRRTDPHAR